MSQRVPLALLGVGTCRIIGRPLRPIVDALERALPDLPVDLKKTDLGTKPHDYLTVAMVNTIIFFLIFYGLFAALLIRVSETQMAQALTVSIAYAAGVALLVLLLFLRYPKIIAGKKSESIDTYLIFALKEMLLQISSGISLYNAIVNLSKQNYGSVSKEFGLVARDVNAGMPLFKALEQLADRNASIILRRTVWQLNNAQRAGSSLQGAMRAIIDDATADKRTRIHDFSQELNLWGLLYMTFAVAVPSIGLTMMIILSTFGSSGIGKTFFIVFIAGCFVMQMALIGFIQTRRPVVSV
jgi:flagellar protein FlaJ